MTNDLKKYREKRDFNKTPEPQGVKKKEETSKALIFAIQKHRTSQSLYFLFVFNLLYCCFDRDAANPRR